MVVHVQEFLGRPIENYEPDRPLANPRSAAIRVALSPDECDDEVSILENLASLFNDPKVGEIIALIIGVWSKYTEGSEPIVESIVSARERLPNLRGLFLGDIDSEELDMSWITQSDVSSLFVAFPRLEVFRVRGNAGLEFHAMDHENLRTLIIESGVTDPNSTRNQVELAKSIVDRISRERRVLLFLNISAVHQPNRFYVPGAECDNLETHAAALAYVDSQLPTLVHAMRRRRPVLCIFCSDHGTAYGEDGHHGHRLGHPVVWTVPYAEFVLPEQAP